MLSWIGNVFIVAGLWYQGGKHWWAFIFSLIGEAFWIEYAVQQHLWSLAFICCVFGGLALRNLILWLKG